jgi:hypothetical protein
LQPGLPPIDWYADRGQVSTIEHVFGTLKHWMGATHFLTRGLAHVNTEMSLYVLAYNLKRVIKLLGMPKTLQAMRLLGA